MKKAEIKIGECYEAKVSGKLTTVKILCKAPYKGWKARNLKTGRQVYIKTAARLHWRVQPAPVFADPTSTPTGEPSVSSLAATSTPCELM